MRRRLVWCLAIALPVVACSEPPVKERNQAEGALTAARAAEAATYAADELAASEAALKRYDEFVAQRDYRQALNAALDARDRAYEAARQAGNAKAAARSDAERLLAEAGTLSKAGNARLTGPAPARPTAAAAERLRTAIHAAAPAMQEARTWLDKRDYRQAVGVLTPVVNALRKELSPADSGRRRGR
jgi:hypothetical protein